MLSPPTSTFHLVALKNTTIAHHTHDPSLFPPPKKKVKNLRAKSMLSSSPNPRVITSKAAVAYGAGQPLVIEEVDVSPPQPNEIRIKVVCTSLYGSDVGAWLTHSLFLRTFGHEASGIVESVGVGVTEFEEGDHVLTLFTGECKRCKKCTSDKGKVCQNLGLERRGIMHSDQKKRFSVRGSPVFHYWAVLSFSEYIVVHSGCAVIMDSSAPLEKICLLSCGIATGN